VNNNDRQQMGNILYSPFAVCQIHNYNS
jgi:hypothetical protein